MAASLEYEGEPKGVANLKTLEELVRRRLVNALQGNASRPKELQGTHARHEAGLDARQIGVDGKVKDGVDVVVVAKAGQPAPGH